MPLTWNPALNDLISLLAGLYPDRDKARLAVKRAAPNLEEEIDFVAPPKVLWMRIVEEANKRDQVPDLINVAQEDFPNVNFAVLDQQVRRPTAPPSPRLGDDAWRGPVTIGGVLEKVIGAQPTFVPISFLEMGLLRAKSVVRVESSLGVGSGFLTRNNLLITNHHVISSPAEARAAKVWFNYQKTATGADARVEEFVLDPDSAFVTSPMEDGDDWTAVRVRGDPNGEWGQLDLADMEVRVNDYVNIIQHPHGMPKQIALYHNVVAFADDSRVQYLTDTMPGSSGSPVFDSEWRVVALHHSGGWIPEPGTERVFLRNEGIHVRALLKGLREHQLLGT
jgi:hypothetical protein